MEFIDNKEDLLKALNKTGLTRRAVADALGITEQAVFKWVHGRAPVPRYAGMWFYYAHGIDKKAIKTYNKKKSKKST